MARKALPVRQELWFATKGKRRPSRTSYFVGGALLGAVLMWAWCVEFWRVVTEWYPWVEIGVEG